MAGSVSALALVVLLLSSGAFSFAVHFDYPAVFNFGDSNSDTGNRIAAGFDTLEPPHGQTYFKAPAGRFCDGRLILDFLVDAMGLPFLNPYLDSVGAPSFRKGCNYASAGSTVLPLQTSAASSFPFPLGIQVAEFLRFKHRVLQLLLAKGNKVKKHIPPADFFTKGLYMFDMSQNDLARAFDSQSEDHIIVAFIPTILSEFETGLKTLYEQGARRFWIHNTGPFGCLPRYIAGKDPTSLDEFGCVSSHNRVAKQFNSQLRALCTRLRGTFTDANVTHVDIFSIKYDLIANHSKYGFEHPIMACCGYGGPPLNFQNLVRCGKTGNLNGTLVTAKGCNDPSKYINWDGIHYTDAANLHVSSEILTGKYSDPPFSDKTAFLSKHKY